METLTQSPDGQDRMKVVKEVLSRHERYRVLELYFCREGGRLPEQIPPERKELLEISQEEMKEFLLGQFPQDPLLHKFLRIIQ
jgi:hypothetical protein